MAEIVEALRELVAACEATSGATGTQPSAMDRALSRARATLNDGSCLARALPDEPIFVLLGRDPQFYPRVTDWANARSLSIDCGDRPDSDRDIVSHAFVQAIHGAAWRKANNGKWRK